MDPKKQIPKIAIYARVSTTHHDQKPEVQINELKRYCVARDWSIEHELIDHGYSGGTDIRPGLKQLLFLARAREINTIIVVKLDRLFRSLKHLVVTLEELQTLGITFISIKDAIDYSTPSGRLMIQILGSLSEFEKSLLVERTLAGLEYAKSKGKILGRPKTRDDKSIRDLRSLGLPKTLILSFSVDCFCFFRRS